MAIDPFARDDAAYVLGALPDDERIAFEKHLGSCVECRARVSELRDVPDLLADVSVADLDPDGRESLAEPPPDTLLPALLRAASARRRRTRAAITALGAVAAACVIALVVALWPASTTAPQPPASAARQFVALVSAPVSATAVLTAKNWGTEIDLKCVYSASIGNKPVPYKMWAYTKHNGRYPAGGWKQLPEVTYVGGTSLSLSEIARIDIELPNGKPILRLTTG